MNQISNLIPKLIKNIDLSAEESKKAFEYIISGNANEIEVSSLLTSLSIKGCCSQEIVGAAKALLPNVVNPLDNIIETMDIVGTGGDGLKTYNISTATSFVVASHGVKVAKHGNTAVSSKSGSSDVLKELGVNISINNNQIKKCLTEANICFLFAPNFNKAFKNVANVRKKLNFRTIFNILGPILNPVRSNRQLLGVFSDKYIYIIADALKMLNSKKSWIVNGSDGMDEITLTGITKVAELDNNKIKEFEINPVKYNFKLCSQKDLRGGNPSQNAEKILNLFKGEEGSYRDIVILNAAAAFCVSESVRNFEEGISLASSLINNGSALETLQKLIIISNE